MSRGWLRDTTPGDSRDNENPVIIKRAHDRPEAIIQLLVSYGIN